MDSMGRDLDAANPDWDREVSVQESDRSCWMPVLFLFWKAAGWLFLGMLFALVNSFRFYQPDFLAYYSWLTFGRIEAAASMAFVYGFALQSAMAAALWLLARTGRTVLVQPGYVFLGAAFWNLGVLAGVAGILAGDGMPHGLFEMPKYASPILFVAYLILGGLAFVTFQRRRVRELYVSQWFLFAALLWFPWIFSAASWLLHFYPVRGVTQAVIAGWYAAGLKTLVLGGVGLAVIFYLIPKLQRRPLHSRYLALFSFWLLLFFGNGAGILSGTTVPAWISGLSAVMAFFVCFAAVMVGWNLYHTAAGRMSRLWQPDLRFVAVSLLSFLLAGLLNAINAFSGVAEWTQFTLVLRALDRLVLVGFFAMAMFGIAYCLLPRILGAEWPGSKLINLHFWLTAIGLSFTVAVLGVGGWIQGQMMNDDPIPFSSVSAMAARFLQLEIFGLLLLFGGSLLFLVNVGRISCRAICYGEKEILCWFLSAEEEKAAEELPALALSSRPPGKKGGGKENVRKEKDCPSQKKRAKKAAKKS